MRRISTAIKVIFPLIVISLLILLILAPIFSKPDTRVLANGASLTWTKCWFTVPSKRKVRCGWYKPHGIQPDKTNIKIPIVYIHYRFKTQATPVLHINGGPGYSTGLDKKGINRWLQWVDQTGWKRDVVFWDHRGTGLSTPLPVCDQLLETSISGLSQNQTMTTEVNLWYQFMQKCQQQFKKLNIPLNTFSTENSVQDSLNIMALIGAKRWKIYASSYGTRVALQIMRDAPQNIDAVILDSVYPTRIHDLLVTPYFINSAFNALFNACSYHYICFKLFPSLEKSIQNAVKILNQSPQTYYVKVAGIPQKIKVVLNGNRLIWAIHGAMYDWTHIEKIPAYIYYVKNKQWVKLHNLVKDYATKVLEPSFIPITYYSTECRDRQRRISEQDYNNELAKYPFIKPHINTLWKKDVCQFWTAGRTTQRYFVPVKSNIPTLIMNGMLDPATPWQWAKEVHKNMDNSFLFIIKGVGHGAVDGDQCGAATAKAFLNKPQQKPILKCQKSWQHPLFKLPKSLLKLPNKDKAKTHPKINNLKAPDSKPQAIAH